MSCTSCGYNPCQCLPVYSYNWYNTTNLPCNPCITTNFCKKTIPALCTTYNGPALVGLGLTTAVNVELVLTTISLAVATLNAAITTHSDNIVTLLNHINDINDRLNILEGGSIPPYTL